ncbi:MAG: UDP-3-O-(3-hydroxymyristoyl)glucosamine N-acyltransferase [Saprospiraceae bacterium]|nr:UDP-3-O-(3-hydroxymyristoyl)glucosamine N-acyltransferase [Saprospiraceae bacterium]
MTISAQTLAQMLNGVVEGNPSVSVSRPGKIESGRAGEICFLSNEKYEQFAYSTEASILLVSHDFRPKQALKPTLIRVSNVYESLAFLLEKFSTLNTSVSESIISERASIDPSVFLGENIAIGDFAVIEKGVSIGQNTRIASQVFIGKNTQIGENCMIHIGVKIYDNAVIGSNCMLHAGVVIGSDGFGFAPQANGSYKKIHHVGNVVIENNVEIGANTTIDRASIGSTIIRQGVKLDNLIQIAHNVEIGENTVVAAQTGISGSTKIGKNCRIGGQVGIVGHITIGDGVQIQAQSGIAASLESGAKVYGSPAIGYGNYLRSYAIFKILPDLAKRVLALEKNKEK